MGSCWRQKIYFLDDGWRDLACVAWRFCRAGRTERCSREIRARSPREKVASAPISSRFLCPRPPSLLSAPNQNRHATQARRDSVYRQALLLEYDVISSKITKMRNISSWGRRHLTPVGRQYITCAMDYFFWWPVSRRNTWKTALRITT